MKIHWEQNIKQRERIVSVSMIVLFVLIYFLAIGKTITAWRESGNLSEKLSESQSTVRQLDQLRKEEFMLNRRFGNQESPAGDSLTKLSVLTASCRNHHISLSDVPPVRSQQNSIFNIETREFTMKGEFSNLLSLLYELEQVHHIGPVVSSDFHAGYNAVTKLTELSLTLYLQDFKKIKI